MGEALKGGFLVGGSQLRLLAMGGTSRLRGSGSVIKRLNDAIVANTDSHRRVFCDPKAGTSAYAG